ncbi:hypothetical protein L932_02405 [Helicobacter pylori PZ5026]|nr:hypothetical protein L932_02405 [Helicobacter pylori PZ5026]
MSQKLSELPLMKMLKSVFYNLIKELEKNKR